MKNVLLFLVVSLSIISCEDIEVNEFAMQANIENRFYKSYGVTAGLDEDGRLVIKGTSSFETLQLRLSGLGIGNYIIGEGSTNSAYFEDVDGNRFSTDPGGTGLIRISEINETNKTLNGSFYFNGILAGIDTVFVSKGVLYNVSYNSSDIVGPTDARTLSAKINGNLFTSTLVSVANTANSFKIAGSNLTDTIEITLPNNVEVGEFLLTQSGFGAKYENESGAQIASEGILTITEHNLTLKKINGTFMFIADQNAITEGQFEVVYQ